MDSKICKLGELTASSRTLSFDSRLAMIGWPHVVVCTPARVVATGVVNRGYRPPIFCKYYSNCHYEYLFIEDISHCLRALDHLIEDCLFIEDISHCLIFWKRTA